MNILLCLSFLGSSYSGWQVQNNSICIQQVFQNAVSKVLGSRFPVTGCSRTDAGVHAFRYYCTVRTDGTENKVPLQSLPSALNIVLPDDISVSSASEVPESFHPRYDALEKEYIYRIWNQRQRDPFWSGRAFHLPKSVDLELMNRACSFFIGKHDFSSCMASGSDVLDRVRTVKSFSASGQKEPGLIEIAVSADGFLYHMVRILVGTLIDICYGKIDLETIPARLKSLDRSQMGFTAPSCGLYLNRVVYREPC